VLGCSGGELPKHRTTCFLVDGTLAIDAGALTASLTLDELVEVDDILLTHSHFDHIKDVPLLADLICGQRKKPVMIHASTECAATLMKSVFNGKLWPDFTRIPDREHPVLTIRTFDPTRRFKIGRYTVQPAPVSHPVESVGFVVSDGASSIAVSGDTGPTTVFWRKVNAARNLKALLVETSFPNKLQGLADVSGHLTPQTLAGELAKVKRNGYPVLVYHLKPAYAAELKRDLAALRLPDLRVLSLGEELHL
jgi:cAMP phosphodiesterase